MNTTVTEFTDRESYLCWRAQWKSDYAATSQRIRDLKNIQKEEARAANKANQQMASEKGYDDWFVRRNQIRHAILEKIPRYLEAVKRTSRLNDREMARLMLDTLKRAKIKAQELYLKAHETVKIEAR